MGRLPLRAPALRCVRLMSMLVEMGRKAGREAEADKLQVRQPLIRWTHDIQCLECVSLPCPQILLRLDLIYVSVFVGMVGRRTWTTSRRSVRPTRSSSSSSDENSKRTDYTTCQTPQVRYTIISGSRERVGHSRKITMALGSEIVYVSPSVLRQC